MLIAKEKIQVKQAIVPSFSWYVDHPSQDSDDEFKNHIDQRKGKSILGGNSIELENLDVRAFSQTQAVDRNGNHDDEMNNGDKDKIIKGVDSEVESFAY